MKQSTSNRQKPSIKVRFNDVRSFEEKDITLADFVHWQPLYDLYTIADNILVRVEIAGVKLNDITIHLRWGYMIITGVKRSPEIYSTESCVFHNLEIPYGRFFRRIDFPTLIDMKNYQYKFEDGILTLKFPILKEKIIPID